MARVALSTSSVFPGSAAEAFSAAARLGYDGVEVMVWTDRVSQDPLALGRLAEHYGVPVLAVHAPTLLMTQHLWGTPWEKVDRSLDLAAALGAEVVVVHPPFRWQREYAASFVDGVADRTRRPGPSLAVENMYPWRAGTREVLAYAPGWDPTRQAYEDVVLDLSHTATAGADALAMVAAAGSRLRHVHLADGSGSARDEHLVPGHGTQPCAAVLELLAGAGWSGTVVAEVSTRRMRDPLEREAALAESVAFARRHLAGGRASGGALSDLP